MVKLIDLIDGVRELSTLCADIPCRKPVPGDARDCVSRAVAGLVREDVPRALDLVSADQMCPSCRVWWRLELVAQDCEASMFADWFKAKPKGEKSPHAKPDLLRDTVGPASAP